MDVFERNVSVFQKRRAVAFNVLRSKNPIEMLTPFPKLPLEIRQEIWSIFAANLEPRTVRLFVVSEDEKWKIARSQRELKDVTVVQTDSKVPALLHINSETRRIARKLYRRILGDKYGQTPIYLNFALDTLFIKDYRTWFMVLGALERIEHAVPFEQNLIQLNLRHLAVGGNISNADEISLLLLFPNLQTLTVEKCHSPKPTTSLFNIQRQERSLTGFQRYEAQHKLPKDHKSQGYFPKIIRRLGPEMRRTAQKEKDGFALIPKLPQPQTARSHLPIAPRHPHVKPFNMWDIEGWSLDGL